jgi:hypothetical protein
MMLFRARNQPWARVLTFPSFLDEIVNAPWRGDQRGSWRLTARHPALLLRVARERSV